MAIATQKQADDDRLKSGDQEDTKEKAREYVKKIKQKGLAEKKDEAVKQRISNFDPASLPTYRCQEILGTVNDDEAFIDNQNKFEIEREVKDYFQVNKDKLDNFVAKKVAQMSDDPKVYYDFYDKSKKLTSLQSFRQKEVDDQKNVHEQRLVKYITEANQIGFDPKYQPSIWRRITDSLKITPEYKPTRQGHLEEDIRIEKSFMSKLDQEMKDIGDLESVRNRIVDGFIVSETGKKLAEQKKASQSTEDKPGYHQKIRKPAQLARQYSKEYSPEKRDQLAKEIKEKRKKRVDRMTQLRDESEVLYKQGANWEENRVIVKSLEKQIEEEKRNYIGRLINFKLHQARLTEHQGRLGSEKESMAFNLKIKDEREKLNKEFYHLLYDKNRYVNLKNKSKLKEFYTTQEKEMLEKKAEKRVEDISKMYNVAIVHGIKNNSNMTVSALKAGNWDFATKLKVNLAVEPAISTYTIGKNQNADIALQGIILKKGDITASHYTDALSQAVGKKDRIVSSQSTLDKSIFERGSSYNELVVKNPEFAGLYISLDKEGSYDKNGLLEPMSETEIHKNSIKYQMPVYGFQNGIPYEMTFDKVNQQYRIKRQVNLKDILENKFEVSDETKIKINGELGDIYKFHE